MDFTDDADTNADSEASVSVSDAPPEPERATIEDVSRYTEQWASENPRAATKLGKTNNSDSTVELPFTAKSVDKDDTRYKSEYPWLYDPSRGVRWDFDPIELRVLAQENAWVGMLVQTISKEIAETSWTITAADDAAETRKRLSTHPEQREPVAKELPDSIAEEIHGFLMEPNPDHDWYDLVEMWMSDLLEVGSLAGVKAFPSNAYDDEDNLAVDAAALTPRALMPTAPEVWTKDYSDKAGVLDGFWQFDKHSSPGQTQRTRGSGQPLYFDREEVVWSDMAPRTNRRYGMPPTLLIRDFLQSLDLAVTQEQQYLSRGSIPSGAWVFENWDRHDVEDWQSENAENIKGKPHKSLMFGGQGGDVRFEPMSMNFKELEFTERMRWYARVVASAFQVPTAVVGIEPEKVNYATFQGERENFESNTLGPYLQQFERVINKQIIRPHWGDDYRFEFIPGMSETTRKMISERVSTEFQQNLTTRNEARRELGRDAVDDELDGFKSEVVEDPDPENPLDGVAFSTNADFRKSEGDGDDADADTSALRNSDDFQQFDLQPGAVDRLHEDIREDIEALFARVLEDDDLQREIDEFAAPPDPDDAEAKSLNGITRRIREFISDTDVVDRITDAIQSASAAEVGETLRRVASEEDADVETDPIVERLSERDVAFADSFAERMADDIRETVADGWLDGKNSLEIRDDLQDQADQFGDWQAERIARQELQIATGEARNQYAAEAGKVEVWMTSDDGRVREPHAAMDGLWKRPAEDWEVDYSAAGRGVQHEHVPGDSEPGIGCRCQTLLVDIDEVDPDDHAGV